MVLKSKSTKNSLGFTVAEVIIVLGIIGIIALNTLPVLLTDLNNNVLAQSKDLILRKITEATNQMKTNEVLINPPNSGNSWYYTTDDFVNEFQKYIKVAKRCTATNLNECFTQKFTTESTNEVINLNNLHTGLDLGHDTIGYNTPLVGLQLVDGTNIIMDHFMYCNWGKPIPFWDNTTSTTACLSMLYDVNGFKGPNKIGKDIATLNATISDCDGAKIGALCIAGGDTTFSPISEAPYTSGDNYWAGARDACAAQGMRLPTVEEYETTIYNYFRNYVNPSFNSSVDFKQYWSSTPMNDTVSWGFSFSGGNGSRFRTGKNQSGPKARCVK